MADGLAVRSMPVPRVSSELRPHRRVRARQRRAGPRRRTRARRTAARARRGRCPTRPPPKNSDREQAAEHPDELEPGLEARERPAARGLGAVALQQAVEREASAAPRRPRPRRRRTRARRRPYERAANSSGIAGATSEPARIHSSRTRLREQRRDERAERVADRAADEHQPEHPGRLALLLQHERGEEGGEADDAAHEPHRGAGDRRCSARAAAPDRVRSPAAPTLFGAWDRRARRTMPSTKITAPSRSTHAAPVELGGSRPRPVPATTPPTTAISARREFASTSSSWLSTTAGTSALLATDWPFDSTSIAKASG